MATNTKFSLVLQLFLGISMVMFSIPGKADDEPKETKMSVYFHDHSGGPNSTVLPVVGFPGKIWSVTQFGTLFVSDDPITQSPDPESAPVGRGQGIFASVSLDGLNAYVSLSIVCTNEAYNGSTIQIQGNSNQFKAVREYGVASGTGKFRYARGFVTFENYSSDNSTSYAVIRCNVSIRHY